MTVQTIEFSHRYLDALGEFGFGKERLINYFDNNPHLVASYQVFLDIWSGKEERALVVETKDLSVGQLEIFALGMGLITRQLRFVTPYD